MKNGREGKGCTGFDVRCVQIRFHVDNNYHSPSKPGGKPRKFKGAKVGEISPVKSQCEQQCVDILFKHPFDSTCFQQRYENSYFLRSFSVNYLKSSQDNHNLKPDYPK